MKKVIIREEQEKLLKESGYGNDDLVNLFEDLKYAFSNFSNIIGEHLIMCKNMRQEPNKYVSVLHEYAMKIDGVLESFGNEVGKSM
jgi:hypothetical protein